MQRVAGEDEQAAVVAVCCMARGQNAEKAGKKERESGEAEHGRAVRELVDLPGDGDGLRLRADDGDKARHW